MRGDVATIPDIVLDTLVCPDNLYCDESLPPDVEPEEERYKIDTYCFDCSARLRLYVVASSFGIRSFQHLLLTTLHLTCPGCARRNIQHGRSN
ncbi:E7 [Human papillomavirus 132]|uniref:Protein E7 n=1 Tax=Human papillomavirus 132 TaxID=909331 RepID=E7BQ94_9PAPI|nr:E7 [Human papillomavirus 132]ADQ85965.1 E7 [Human papillomavirus 132]